MTEVRRRAILSEDRVYRYALAREWGDPGVPVSTLSVVMLNPSTADDQEDDPTIRRCLGFARSWGYGSLYVVNLYAFRATDPVELVAAGLRGVDIVGEQNDRWLKEALVKTTAVVVAWGARAPEERVEHFQALAGARRVYALGTTKSGAPRHPLYVPGKARPVQWLGR